MQHTNFSWRTGSDQLKIHGQVWQPLPGTETIAVIALVHGMGEHSGRYRRFAEFFATHGIAIIAFDQRGHGKSEGKKGHITHYNQLLDGIDELLERARLQFKDKPVFLYGHSMGGNLVLNYALKKPNTVKGVIATGPWLKLAFEPPAFQLKLAHLMRNLYPGFTQGSNLKTAHLSHDPEIVKAYERDRLVHDRISASFFMNLYQAGLYALQHANELKVSSLVMHGGDDKITSQPASEEFARKANVVAEYKLWDGMYHEIHNEPEKEAVLQHVVDWIRRQINR
jgi:alpha-beta hydrolase superfamily lysophospholipase